MDLFLDLILDFKKQLFHSQLEQNLPHLLPLIASSNSNKSQRSSPQNATDPAENNAFGVKRNECARTHRNKATTTDLHLPASRFSRRRSSPFVGTHPDRRPRLSGKTSHGQHYCTSCRVHRCVGSWFDIVSFWVPSGIEEAQTWIAWWIDQISRVIVLCVVELHGGRSARGNTNTRLYLCCV